MASRVLASGDGITLSGQVSGPRKDFVGWVYADPDGGQRHTLNCSIADLKLTVQRPGRAPQRLRASGGAAYEIGMHEIDHGIPIRLTPTVE